MLTVPANIAAVIKASLQDCLNTTTTFLEHVKAIMGVGVMSYEVDLIKSKVIYYLQDGVIFTVDLPAISNEGKKAFNQIALKSAIIAAQSKSIDYLTFLNQIVFAGATSYRVNMATRKVVYQNNNETYTEEFPKLI